MSCRSSVYSLSESDPEEGDAGVLRVAGTGRMPLPPRKIPIPLRMAMPPGNGKLPGLLVLQ